jgi:HAD superfamily hydrolase (TIGR01484 family)
MKEIKREKERINTMGRVIVLDIDDTLIFTGLEASNVSVWAKLDHQLRDYFEKNNSIDRMRKEVSKFRQLIGQAKEEGYKIIISTGRQLESTKRVLKLLTDNQPKLKFDGAVLEGGNLVYFKQEDGSVVLGPPEGLDPEGRQNILNEDIRKSLDSLAITELGCEKQNKQIVLAYCNPTHEDLKPDFDENGEIIERTAVKLGEKIINFLEEKNIKGLEVTIGKTTVEIGIKGATKLVGLNYLFEKMGLKGKGSLYIGDDKRDAVAFSIAENVGGPANSDETVKKYISENGGYLADEPILKGTNQILTRFLGKKEENLALSVGKKQYF